MLLVGKEGLSLLSLMLRSGKAQIIKICLNHSPSKVRESFQRKLRVVRTMNLASSCCRSPVRVEINIAVNLENQGLLRSKQLEISIFSALPTSRPMYSGTVGWLPIWLLEVSGNPLSEEEATSQDHRQAKHLHRNSSISDTTQSNSLLPKDSQSLLLFTKLTSSSSSLGIFISISRNSFREGDSPFIKINIRQNIVLALAAIQRSSHVRPNSYSGTL